MAGRPSLSRMFEVLRFYQAGLVNLAFGIACYMALVWLGMGKYPAQFVSHVMGTAFNYLTYSAYVFRDAPPAKLRFVASYVVAYLLGLAMLIGVSQFIANDYIAGLVAALLVSMVNYFGLRHLVFRPAGT